MSQQYGENSQVYFHKVDKIAYGSYYMILKLWEIHNFIFTNVFPHKRVVTVVRKVKKMSNSSLK